MQLTHDTSKFNKKQFPIVLVCDNITNAPNIGSLFRIADAFGIEQLIFCGDNIPLGKRMTKTSRSTEKYVNYKTEHSIHNVVQKLKRDHYKIIALEITEKSSALSDLIVDPNKPIALILGDENFGVSEDILKLSDVVCHINMYGNNSSMNVTQAASIALYEITKQM